MAKKFFWCFIILFLVALAIFSTNVFLTYRDFVASAQATEFSKNSYDQLFSKAQKLSKELRPIGWVFSVLPSKFQDRYELLEKIVKAKPIIDELLSFDRERTFLVVMQNNTELRPSGGFWGAYGILKIRDGKIVSFTTGNSATLDLANQSKYEAPTEAKEYFGRDWRFMSANWSPDFAQSALQGLFFYHQIYPDQYFDGVIGPNVDYLLTLLQITGDIPVPNHNFSVNPTNFVQKMIYESVDPAVYLEKKNDPNFFAADETRKPLLADLAKTMLERIVASQNYRSFGQSTLSALSCKDLILYFTDNAKENTARDLGWSGTIDTSGNFVMVVDGNMGSKLDFLIDKSGQIEKIADDMYKVSLTYKNNYDATNPLEKQYFITYRSLVRLFVPSGSKLVSFSGGQNVAQEHFDEKTGSTFFNNLVIIKPGESTTLTFVWRLPEKATPHQIKILKQAGSKLKL